MSVAVPSELQKGSDGANDSGDSLITDGVSSGSKLLPRAPPCQLAWPHLCCHATWMGASARGAAAAEEALLKRYGRFRG